MRRCRKARKYGLAYRFTTLAQNRPHHLFNAFAGSIASVNAWFSMFGEPIGSLRRCEQRSVVTIQTRNIDTATLHRTQPQLVNKPLRVRRDAMNASVGFVTVLDQ